MEQEQLNTNQQVIGSNPAVSSNFFVVRRFWVFVDKRTEGRRPTTDD